MTNYTKLFSCTKNRPGEPPCLTLASVIAFALMLFPASFEVEQRERDSNWIIFVTELPTDSTRSHVAIELRDSPFITDLITNDTPDGLDWAAATVE